MKFKEHKTILITAVLFDILAIIPVISIFFNLMFGLILYFYFSGQEQKKSFLNTAAFMFFGTIIDSVISILPVNLAATWRRISKSK